MCFSVEHLAVEGCYHWAREELAYEKDPFKNFRRVRQFTFRVLGTLIQKDHCAYLHLFVKKNASYNIFSKAAVSIA